MQPQLCISVLYQDADLVEIAVSAWNGLFGGNVEMYVSHGELQHMAVQLRGFPASAQDERTFMLGTFDPNFAGGGALMRFFCIDRAGHAQLECRLETMHSQSKRRQRVEFFANIEPASVDSFVPVLMRIGASESGTASLRFADALNRE